ncbi:Uncharacterized protein PPKH_0573 [Pseudomonas putida]|nr:Uncharacterized protein PPKH_0573 [Pseudomonas putida]
MHVSDRFWCAGKSRARNIAQILTKSDCLRGDWWVVGLRGVVGLPGVRHNTFSACETERRPRGASRGKPAPTVCFGPRTPGCMAGD